MASAAFLLRHLTEFTLFALSVYFYGRFAAHRLPFQDRFEQMVISCALGLGIFASLLNLLGLVGAITRPVIGALIGVPLLVRAARRRAFERLPPSLDGLLRFGALILLLPLLAALALALYPPTAFDATLYHLPIAKAFSQKHGIAFLPDLRFPVSPQLFELLYAGGLTLSDDVTAQLAHFFALAVTSLGLIAWGRRFATPRAGVWAAAAWLGNPIVLAVGAAAMVDVGLALFCTFALYAWEAWRASLDPGWLAASAVFAGFAASTKYLGLFFVAALAVAMLFAPSARRGLRPSAQFAAIALLILAPFYWRIVSQTRNPVFPYLSRLFGDSAWSEWLDPLAANSEQKSSSESLLASRIKGLGNARSLLQVPWKLVVPGSAFGGDTILSPLLLLLSPFLLWRALKDRPARFILIVGTAYGLCWYLAFPDKRFLLPVLPAWTAGAAAGMDDLVRRFRAARHAARTEFVAAAFAFILAVPGTAWTARMLRRRGPLPVSRQERDAYLTRWLPVYPALRYLNESHGSRYVVYVLFRENAAYFADGRFLGDHFGPYRYSLVTGTLGDPQRLREVLKRMGVTHLLIDRTEGSGSRLPVHSYATAFRSLPSPAGTALFALSEP